MKILQLGGAFHQSFFVEELAANNYFVECLDNLPNNPGHSYAEKSYNISITDIKKIKEILTQDNYIISSYGSDLAELSRNKLVEDNGSHINLLMKYSARLFLQKVFRMKIRLCAYQFQHSRVVIELQGKHDRTSHFLKSLEIDKVEGIKPILRANESLPNKRSKCFYPGLPHN